MKRFLIHIGVLVLCTSGAGAADPDPLHTIESEKSSLPEGVALEERGMATIISLPQTRETLAVREVLVEAGS